MENINANTSRNLNYNFIAVPTNLFFSLDNNLRNALTVLLQLSSVFADSDGYFFRTNEDLQSDFKMGKNLTIAVLESLYQYGLLQVKSVGFTKKNGKRQVNFFRVNTERFKDFEKFHIYTITKNEELHLETVDYKSKDFKVTYTASTVENQDTTGNSPTSVQNNVSEEIPSNTSENVLERQETPNLDFVELAAPTEDEKNDEIIPTESDKDLEYLDFVLSSNNGVDETEEIKKVAKEVEEIEKEEKQKELQQKLVVNVDGKKIETASAIPTNVEKRYIFDTRPTNKLDATVLEKCKELVKRYKEMEIPSSNQSLELCNKACAYFTKQYKDGFIDLEDKDHLIRATIQERFRKHRI